MTLKFYTKVKTKSQKVLAAKSYVYRSYREKLLGGAFVPPSLIGLKKDSNTGVLLWNLQNLKKHLFIGPPVAASVSISIKLRFFDTTRKCNIQNKDKPFSKINTKYLQNANAEKQSQRECHVKKLL